MKEKYRIEDKTTLGISGINYELNDGEISRGRDFTRHFSPKIIMEACDENGYFDPTLADAYFNPREENMQKLEGVLEFSSLENIANYKYRSEGYESTVKYSPALVDAARCKEMRSADNARVNQVYFGGPEGFKFSHEEWQKLDRPTVICVNKVIEISNNETE